MIFDHVKIPTTSNILRRHLGVLDTSNFMAIDRACQRVSALRSRHLPLHCHPSIIISPRAEHTDYSSSSKFSMSGLIGLAQTSASPPVTASPSSIFFKGYYPLSPSPHIRANMAHHFPKGKLQYCFSSSLVGSLF